MKPFLLLFFLSTLSFSQNYDEKETWKNYQAILNSVTSSLTFEGKYGSFHQTAVNYPKLSEDETLQELLTKQKEVLSSATEPMRKTEKLAFWINSYNFFTLVDMAREWPVESMQDIGWKNTHHNVGGKEFSLDQIEHEILRKLEEPRIHFAINCASVGCPSLEKNYYSHRTLGKQLSQATVNALKNPLHLLVEKDGTVLGTELFEWFQSDWAPSGGVAAFVSKYGPVQTEEVRKFSYDWRVNTKENYDEKYKDIEQEFPHYELKRK